MIKKLIDKYPFSVAAPVEALIFSTGLFTFAKLLCFWRPHLDMSLRWDALIPFLPWTVSIYVGTFVFWYVMLVVISTGPVYERERLFCAFHLNALISFLIFILLPTTNVRPELTGGSLWNWIMGIVYGVDTPENLFPSLHCSVAWLCWIGVRGRKDLPRWLSPLALLIAAAICCSTLTTKQHVIVDVPSGILLAELCWQAARSDRLRRIYHRLIERVMAWLQKLAGINRENENGG